MYSISKACRKGSSQRNPLKDEDQQEDDDRKASEDQIDEFVVKFRMKYGATNIS